MIERIQDMSPGTVGLRAAGKLSKDDYVEVLEPALREGIEAGELRLGLRPVRVRLASCRDVAARGRRIGPQLTGSSPCSARR
jgi:hypothetical protein